MRKIAAIMVFIIAVVFVAGAAMAVPPGKEIIFPGGPMGDVHFTGDMHVTKHNMKCSECHPKIFPMKSFQHGGTKFTMADIRAGKYCGECHNGKTAFAVAGNCGKCHKK